MEECFSISRIFVTSTKNGKSTFFFFYPQNHIGFAGCGMTLRLKAGYGMTELLMTGCGITINGGIRDDKHKIMHPGCFAKNCD